MLILSYVIAVLFAAAAAEGSGTDLYPQQASTGYSDEVTVRYFKNGRAAEPPVPLAESLHGALVHDSRRVEETVKEILATHLYDAGYFSAEIDSITYPGIRAEIAPTIYIHVTTGCRYRIGALNYRVADKEPELLDRFVSFYGEGDEYDRTALESEFRRAIRHMENQGYPLARLQITGFHPDHASCTVDIDAELEAGRAMTATGVVTNPVKQIRPDYIQTASGVREDDTITPDLFRRGRRNLENTGFFRQVSEGDLLIRDGDTYIYYDVEEQRANHFDLMFGYVPGQATGNDIVGRGEMLIRNVGWTGSTLQLMFERLDNMVTRLESGFEREWIMGQPLGSGIDFRFVQQDTSYQIREIHLMGTYRRTPERRYSLHLGQQNVSANDDPALNITVLDGVTRTAGFGFRFDNTDSRFTPRRGMFFDLYVESGFRRIDDVRAEELGSRGTMMQQRVRSSLKTYYSPFARQILALGIHGALIESPEYTETDVMPLGGSRSIRGYREEQFRVARYAWSELEYRYLLDPYSHAFVFGAAGGYERPAMLGRVEDSSSGWLYSGGFGFRFQTPIGLMQFTYAVSAEDPLHNGKVHFSLTAGF
ncbi:MAG: hypothetical protein EA363_10670 [Balneolaceae bacterium]|nr:MAG: hypothetical protein EA363_10670 [Balneolaceae bacterium]